MKIIFLLSHLRKQGPTTQFLYLAKSLQDLGCQVDIITFRSFTGIGMGDIFKELQINVFDISSLSFKNRLQQVRLSADRVDIVCSYGLPADFLNFLSVRSGRRVSFVRNQLFRSYWHTKGVTGFFMALVNYILLKSFSHVFSCSDAVKNYLSSVLMASNVVRNSINISVINKLQHFYSSTNDIFENKSELGEKSKKRFLTISSSLKGKNIEFLLKSFSKQKFNDYELIVLGFVEDYLKKRYNSGNIIYLGFRPNIYTYFQLSDYFVSASLHEGLPNAVLEACTFGLPVLLSDIPEHTEILDLQKFGQIGMSFKLDENCFEDKLIELLMADYKEMSGAAKKLMAKEFCTEKSAEKFLYYVGGRG